MIQRNLNRVVAAGVFLTSAIVYFLTLSPTVVMWDVGEFIAAAKMLQVPHPPGSPLFLLGARVAMMIPISADMAVRAHAFSAILSALGIMFTYLVTVRMIEEFRGKPADTLDRIVVYGAGVIGALSLAFGTTYWGNSIEAEVYGASMFFLTIVMWLATRWLDHAEDPRNEKYILIIAYLIGLSLGVHLLALLAIFPVLMIIYFHKYEVTAASFVKFGIIASLTFFVAYPGIVKWLPGMMDGDFAGYRSEIVAYIPWILLALVCYGVYTSYKKHQRTLHIALVSIVLIFLGYTTYTSVIIRSNEHPPMNENDPSNLARLTSYLNREQYGNAPLFMPRRYSQEPHQQGIYTNYSSDMDFLWRYQLDHMFFRYLFWNYIGAAGDTQDSGVSWKPTWGIPFLIGLFGIYYQFRNQLEDGSGLPRRCSSPWVRCWRSTRTSRSRSPANVTTSTWGRSSSSPSGSAWGSWGSSISSGQKIGSRSAGALVAYGVLGLALLAVPVPADREQLSQHRPFRQLSWPGTTPTTSFSPARRTRSCSPTATTTRSRSGTSRMWRASGATCGS